jgi:hypothetical protein
VEPDLAGCRTSGTFSWAMFPTDFLLAAGSNVKQDREIVADVPCEYEQVLNGVRPRIPVIQGEKQNPGSVKKSTG